jgi:hypothetical protein
MADVDAIDDEDMLAAGNLGTAACIQQGWGYAEMIVGPQRLMVWARRHGWTPGDLAALVHLDRDLGTWVDSEIVRQRSESDEQRRHARARMRKAGRAASVQTTRRIVERFRTRRGARS